MALRETRDELTSGAADEPCAAASNPRGRTRVHSLGERVEPALF